MLWMTLGCTSIIEGSRNFPCRFMILKWISTGQISLSAGHFLLGSTIRGQTLEPVYRLFVECMPRWHPFVFCNVKLQGNLRTHRFLTFLSWLSDCVTSRREKKFSAVMNTSLLRLNCEPFGRYDVGVRYVSFGESKSAVTDIFLLNCSDICSAFGAQVHPLLEKPAINELLQEGRRSKTHKTKQVATWATKEMRKLKQQQVWKKRRLTRF